MADNGEKATTAAPNNTTGPAETTVIPDASERKGSGHAAQTPMADSLVKAEKNFEKVEEKSKASPIQELWSLAKSHGHPEIWGVTLADPSDHVPSQIVFQKYLNANDADLTKAKEQLQKTLDFRRQTRPLEMLKKKHPAKKFEGLGFVSSYRGSEAGAPESKAVFTWNVYGIVKDHSNTFGNIKEFLEWRVALMELALQELSISTATKPITAEYDPYKIFQVHDYKSVSFFSQKPEVKEASKETIKQFAQNYPELLKEKFFVNVPAIMGAIYAFMKLFVAAKTVKKFHPMSNGAALANEFGDSKIKGLGQMLPKEYGGQGDDLKSTGQGPALE